MSSLLPAIIEPKQEKGTPWYKSKKIISVPTNIFTYQGNNMITYKIVPHTMVSNATQRMWRAIHKMYEMYENSGSRIERTKLRFTLREKDFFWYDIVIKQIKGKKRIEFFVTTTEFQADKLKRRLEDNMDITIVEADKDELMIPEENTIIQDIRYLRHDIFSLNTKASEKQTPISSIMGTLDELQHDGDMARLSVCNEVESRQKWSKSSHFANEQLRKDKIPQRARIGVKSFIPIAKTGLAGTINEIHAVITETFNAIANTFFKFNEEDKKTEKLIDQVNTVRDELQGGKVSESSKSKIGQPVFKSRIRIAAHSTDKLTRDTVGETLSLALNELSDNNELVGIPIKSKQRKREVINELNNFKLSKKTKYDIDTNLISVEEMSKLALQMPTRELQRKYSSELKIKKVIEATIPKAFQKKGINIGYAELKNSKIPINIPFKKPDELYRAYTFIGGQGEGKDTAIKNWVIDGCLEFGVSSVIIEAINEQGERGMADGVRDSLPPEKIIDLDLGNGEWIVPMDLTEVIKKLGRMGDSRFADEMIDFIDLSNHTRSRKYLRDAAKASGGSLYNIKRIIEDEIYRFNTIKRLGKQGNIRLANSLSSWGSNEDLGSKIDPILDRLDMFFGNDTLYDIFAQQPIDEVDFEKWMSEGKVIIIRIPNRKLGELATKTLVHWVILKTFMTRMLMDAKSKENGCFFVFNEPEQYATDGLTKLMGRIGTEGRKERMGSLWAFHHWDKLPKDLQQNLMGGGVQQFLFANDHTKTYELSKHRFEDTIPMEEATKLPRHHAIVSLRVDGELQPAFICRMKPPTKISYDNSFLTKRHAQMYGRNWKELQQIV